MHLQLNPSVSHHHALKSFKLLAQDTRNKVTTARGMAAGVYSELDRYMQRMTDVVTDNVLLFWQE